MGEVFRSDSCTDHKLYDPRLPPTIEWVRCGGCRHVHTSGYFEGEAERVLFSKTQDCQQPGYDADRQRELAAETIERVASVCGIESGSWLDVGCGSGALLMAATEYGFEATGTDLREQTTVVLRELGYDAVSVGLECLASVEPFDVISMLDVVEHVPRPGQLLDAAKQRLAPGGALVISMPNADSSVWRMLDSVGKNPYWGELEHYHNFTRDSLCRLLRHHGFDPISYGVSRRYRACMQVIAKPTALSKSRFLQKRTG